MLLLLLEPFQYFHLPQSICSSLFGFIAGHFPSSGISSNDPLPVGFSRPAFVVSAFPALRWSCVTDATAEIQLGTLSHRVLLTFDSGAPQSGAAGAEIKVPSVENTELKGSPFKAWSRSVYSHTCYAYCQGFLACLILSFRSIHLLFFFLQKLSQFFLCWL